MYKLFIFFFIPELVKREIHQTNPKTSTMTVVTSSAYPVLRIPPFDKTIPHKLPLELSSITKIKINLYSKSSKNLIPWKNWE